MSQIVLCADDSVTMQTVAEITFRATEYEYVGARSADEALKLAKEKTPSIILADAVMPGKTGYDLCMAAKSDPDLASVPVLLLCGNSHAFDEARGGEVGADAHITKPWDSQVMIDKVKEVLDLANSNGVAKPGVAAVAPAAVAPAPVAPAAVAPAPVAPAAVAPAPVAPAAVAPAPVAPAAVAPAPVAPPVAAPPKPAAPALAASAMRPPRINGTPTKRPALPGFAAADDAIQRSATIMGMPTLTLPGKDGDGGPGYTPVAGGESVTSADVAKVAGAAAAAVPATAAKVAKEQGLDPNGPEMKALVKLSQDVVERIVWEVVPELAEKIIRENLEKLSAQRQ